jgi:hypothetical protein
MLLVDPLPVFFETGAKDPNGHGAEGADPAADEEGVKVLEDEKH